jgi:hypothetical protein
MREKALADAACGSMDASTTANHMSHYYGMRTVVSRTNDSFLQLKRG